MFKLKPISQAGIPDAIMKAERYRLLNEPRLAESICMDILEVDPGNNEAVIIMLLAITDQFSRSASSDINQAKQLVTKLKSDYEKYYYSGIICERQGKAVLNKNITGSHFTAYEWLRDAMEFYEKAEAIRPTGNDDSILRWNTCTRLIVRSDLKPRGEDRVEPLLE